MHSDQSIPPTGHEPVPSRLEQAIALLEGPRWICPQRTRLSSEHQTRDLNIPSLCCLCHCRKRRNGRAPTLGNLHGPGRHFDSDESLWASQIPQPKCAASFLLSLADCSLLRVGLSAGGGTQARANRRAAPRVRDLRRADAHALDAVAAGGFVRHELGHDVVSFIIPSRAARAAELRLDLRPRRRCFESIRPPATLANHARILTSAARRYGGRASRRL